MYINYRNIILNISSNNNTVFPKYRPSYFGRKHVLSKNKITRRRYVSSVKQNQAKTIMYIGRSMRVKRLFGFIRSGSLHKYLIAADGEVEQR